MKETTAKLTTQYIKEHPHIKSCLKKDLINYSSLARLISRELNITKKSSNEAILIAARRYQHELEKENNTETLIHELLNKTEISIKNKVVVLIIDKSVDKTNLLNVQKKIKEENGLIYFLEGSDSYVFISQEKYYEDLKKVGKIIKTKKDLAIIDLKSPKDIENIKGVIAYLTSLFSENDVNILEFFSCWQDTIFVIDKKDVDKVIKFLNF